MNEISSSAWLDIQLTSLCVCGMDSFLPELEHLWKNVFTVSFPKRRVWNLGVFLRFWIEAEVNFLRREKLCWRDYLNFLKIKAKSGDMAVLELTFRNGSLENWACYRRKAWVFLDESEIIDKQSTWNKRYIHYQRLWSHRSRTRVSTDCSCLFSFFLIFVFPLFPLRFFEIGRLRPIFRDRTSM